MGKGGSMICTHCKKTNCNISLSHSLSLSLSVGHKGGPFAKEAWCTIKWGSFAKPWYMSKWDIGGRLWS